MRVSAAWFHAPLTLAIRSAVTGMLSLGAEPSKALASSAGRAYATAPWNRRRLARAVGNLRVAYPAWPDDQCHAYAIHSYEHLFRLSVEMALAPRLFTEEGWLRHASVGRIAPGVRALIEGRPCVLITGHVGNWEIVGYTIALLGFPMHALYRPIDLVPLDRWIRQVRERRGLMLLDKFGALKQLPEIMQSGGCVGFVADQNGGDRGVFVPFFDRLSSTYKSVGLLAMQFGATIVCGCARRTDAPVSGPVASPACEPALRAQLEGPAEHWTRDSGRDRPYRIELADVFGPEAWVNHPDPLFYLSARFRLAIETMVRRSPEQYDWMHRVWRSRPKHERSNRPFPEALKEKLTLLPWMTSEGLARIIEHSERDARTLAATGQSKLS
jgi:Kdo2-lipid IVA lauroyltransferase/acyltransferase